MGIFDTIAHFATAPMRMVTAPLDTVVAIAKGRNVGQALTGGLEQFGSLGIKTMPGGSIIDAPLKAVGLNPDAAQQLAAVAAKRTQLEASQRSIESVLKSAGNRLPSASLDALRKEENAIDAALRQLPAPTPVAPTGPSVGTGTTATGGILESATNNPISQAILGNRKLELGLVIGGVGLAYFLLRK